MVRSLLVLVMLVSALPAIPLDCIPGSLSSYLALPVDGCRIGQTVVSGFLEPGVLPGSTAIPANAVSVNPLFDLYNEGLLFTYNASASPGEVFESVVQFSVIAIGGDLTFGSLASGGLSASPDGVAIASAEFCFGSYDPSGTCLGSSQAALNAADGFSVFAFDRRNFDSVSSLMLRQNIVVDGGTVGTAGLNAAEVRFGVVPEPATTTLLGIGTLLGLIGVRKRRGGIRG